MKERVNGAWVDCYYGLYERNAPVFENTTSLAIYNRASRNLFDKTATNANNGYIANARLNASDGDNVSNSSCNVSEYINISSNSDYTIDLGFANTNTNLAICFYDSTKTFLRGYSYSRSRYITTNSGTNAKYCRFTYFKSYNDTTMLNSGSTALPYEPYQRTVDSYEFYGNCSQASTPTPSTPVEVEEFGDKTENLIPSIVQGGANYTTGELTNNSTRVRTSSISVVSGNTYTVSAGNLFIATAVGYNSGNFVAGLVNHSSNSGTKLETITVPNGVNEIVIAFRNTENPSSATDVTPSDAQGIMLNSGSTVLPYEPYGKYKVPITSNGATQNIILTEPLRKIGDYADSVDSEGVVTRRIKKLVLDGTEDISMPATSSFQLPNFSALIESVYCTHFTQTTWANVVGVNVASGIGVRTPNYDRCRIAYRDISTLEDFKTWLATQYANGTPVTVYYVLATAVTESTTVPTIPTASGYSNITIGTNLAPSKVELDMGKMFVPKVEKVRVNGEWV